MEMLVTDRQTVSFEELSDLRSGVSLHADKGIPDGVQTCSCTHLEVYVYGHAHPGQKWLWERYPKQKTKTRWCVKTDNY